MVDGRQFNAYEMNISTPTETAMVLPIPVFYDTREDALRFINLESYGDFFDVLDSLFPTEMAHDLSEESLTFVVAPAEGNRALFHPGGNRGARSVCS